MWVAVALRRAVGRRPHPHPVDDRGDVRPGGTVGALPNNSRFSVFYAQTYNSGASQTLTIDFGGSTQTNLAWSVDEQSNPGGGSAVLRSASIYNSTRGQHPHRGSVTAAPASSSWRRGFLAATAPTPAAGRRRTGRAVPRPAPSCHRNQLEPGGGQPHGHQRSTTSVGGDRHRRQRRGPQRVRPPRRGLRTPPTPPPTTSPSPTWPAAVCCGWPPPPRRRRAPAAAPTLTMTGATFTLVRSEVVGTDRMSVWYSQDYDSGTNQVLGFASTALLGLNWTVEEQIPGRTSGTRWSRPISSPGPPRSPPPWRRGPGRCSGVVVRQHRRRLVHPQLGHETVRTVRYHPQQPVRHLLVDTVNTAPSVTIGSGSPNGLIVLEAVSEVAQARIACASDGGPRRPRPHRGGRRLGADGGPQRRGHPPGPGRLGADGGPQPRPPRQSSRWPTPNSRCPTPPPRRHRWDPAAECETLEYRNPAGEVVRFRTLIGTVGRFMPPIGVTTIPVPAGHGSHYLGSAHLERPVAVPVAIPGPLDGQGRAAALGAGARPLGGARHPHRGGGDVGGTAPALRVRGGTGRMGGDQPPGQRRHPAVPGGVAVLGGQPASSPPRWTRTTCCTPGSPSSPSSSAPPTPSRCSPWTTRGDVDAWPVVTVTGPAEDVTVTNLTTGASWHVTGALLPGSGLVVDHRPGQKTVRVDGVNAFDRLAPGSSLWPLARGVNQVDVAAAATDLDTLITFTWRRQWLAGLNPDLATDFTLFAADGPDRLGQIEGYESCRDRRPVQRRVHLAAHRRHRHPRRPTPPRGGPPPTGGGDHPGDGVPLRAGHPHRTPDRRRRRPRHLLRGRRPGLPAPPPRPPRAGDRGTPLRHPGVRHPHRVPPRR